MIPHHPKTVLTYRQIRERTGCLDRVGELTARAHLDRLDRYRLLSLAERLPGGPERAAALLRAVIPDTCTIGGEDDGE